MSRGWQSQQGWAPIAPPPSTRSGALQFIIITAVCTTISERVVEFCWKTAQCLHKRRAVSHLVHSFSFSKVYVQTKIDIWWVPQFRATRPQSWEIFRIQ